MADAVSADLPGKVKRVLGIFIVMLGAGVVLDSRAVWIGAAVSCVGAIMFVWGLIEARPQAEPRDTCLPESQHSPSYPTERSL